MEIIIPVAREVAWKLRSKDFQKKARNPVDGSLNLMEYSMQFPCTKSMPSQHSPDKEPLSLQIPRTLMGRIKKAAKLDKMTLPEYVIAILNRNVNDIVLTSRDYEAIRKATEEAERTGRRLVTKFEFDVAPRIKRKAA